MKSRMIILSLLTLILFFGCGKKETPLKIDYEKYNLENGLQVILHKDASDPIAALAVIYHVGSNREVRGRTGFAHLFEHMMFQESQHVGQDQFFKKIQGAGGTLNGGTWTDGTIYYQVVPKNALEMVMWLESDRMGYLLSTVTQEAFENQQEVVQNEKRQRVDNQPYGHTDYVIGKLLYPEDHPYNWQVIGSLEDLRNATVEDVRNFYKKWYGPNNATLVIAGDFDELETKEWIKKYFGEIKSSPPVDPPKPWNVTLDETKRAYHEDNFAKSPELNVVFPTVEEYNKDAYALSFLADLLADGKKAPLYKVIVEEKKLAPSVRAFQNSLEITGRFNITVRAFPDKNLTDVENAIKESFQKFETEKFTEADLARIKAKIETQFYNGISSILGKSFQLAFYNQFTGSPGYITKDLQAILDVSSADIWNAYNKYIKDKPYVLTSFVPKGRIDLIAANSFKAEVVEESFGELREEKAAGSGTGEPVEKIASNFDRSLEPEKGPDPALTLPEIWNEKLANGLKIYGIQQSEVPLVNFSLTLKGGLLLDDINKIGTANLMTDIMMEGTKNKTPLELEEAIDMLGASINMFTTKESIVIQANCLKSKVGEVYSLVEEILLEPRWDEKEFARIKEETLEIINRNMANPRVIAGNVFTKLIYSSEDILGHPTIGYTESVSAISIDDLKEYYNKNFSPSVSYVCVVGDIGQSEAVKLFGSLESKWQASDVEFPVYPEPKLGEKGGVFFVDQPGAKQSELRIGHLSVTYNDPDYFPITVMNYKLGGTFNSIVNLILREEKGYTYGARTSFTGSNYPGYFVASSAVQSNATLESAKIFFDEISKYREGISEEDLEFTKNALLKSNARRFETLGALMGMLNDIAEYNLPKDYIKKEENIIRGMTLEQHKSLAEKYLHPGKLYFLVVGDAASQMKDLYKLGFGNPVLLDADGNPLKEKIVSMN